MTSADLARALDAVRDRWIAKDPEGWLACHRFYPGVIDRLRALLSGPTRPVIVTTKEGRFTRQLLERERVALPPPDIIGKETRRPKREVLLTLIDAGAPHGLWFVEDRLPTLRDVAGQPGLEAVRLFLADWGYNTADERDSARRDGRIRLLSLREFAQDLSSWPT